MCIEIASGFRKGECPVVSYEKLCAKLGFKTSYLLGYSRLGYTKRKPRFCEAFPFHNFDKASQHDCWPFLQS